MAGVKLVNAVTGSVTGNWFYLGCAHPPFTLTVTGTFVAGDFSVQSSPDSFVGNVLQTSPTPITEFGEVPGLGIFPLSGLAANNFGITILHYVTALRVVTTGFTGVLTVSLEYENNRKLLNTITLPV